MGDLPGLKGDGGCESIPHHPSQWVNIMELSSQELSDLHTAVQYLADAERKVSGPGQSEFGQRLERLAERLYSERWKEYR